MGIEETNYNKLEKALSNYKLRNKFEPELRKLEFQGLNSPEEVLNVRCQNNSISVSYLSFNPELSKDTLKEGPKPADEWYSNIKSSEKGKYNSLTYFNAKLDLESAINLCSHICEKMSTSR